MRPPLQSAPSLPPRLRRQAVLRRFAVQVRAIGVGHDQTGVGGENLARQILREREEQPVAMHPAIPPFLVGAQILHRGLDLDDPDLAALVQRHKVGAPARGSGNSLMQENPSDRNSRAVPRAIASAPSPIDVGRAAERARSGGAGDPSLDLADFAALAHRKRQDDKTDGTRCFLISLSYVAAEITGRTDEGCLVIDDLRRQERRFHCLSVGTYMDAKWRRGRRLQGAVAAAGSPARLGITDLADAVQPRRAGTTATTSRTITASIRSHDTPRHFVEFTHGCASGIRVIIDLVVNHTSTSMPGFAKRAA